MEPAHINWIAKLVDWSWAVVLAAAAALGGGYIKLWRQHDRHHERLTALEGNHDERVRQMDHLARTVEGNRVEISEKLDDLRTELRADLREIHSAVMRRP